MSITINDAFYTKAPRPTDIKRDVGDFTFFEFRHKEDIPIEYRYISMIVTETLNGSVKTYILKDGVTDNDFVLYIANIEEIMNIISDNAKWGQITGDINEQIDLQEEFNTHSVDGGTW